jgi:3-dehydroquinate synthase
MQFNFSIQNQSFVTEVAPDKQTVLTVKSVPRPYTIEFQSGEGFDWLEQDIKSQKHPLLLIDTQVKQKLLGSLDINIPTYEVTAVESNKDITTVLNVCDFLLTNKANRASMLYVVGGGILQDLGAFSSAMFKRGIPWTLVPTTLLSQGDSCLGGKTAVNYGSTKNVLGLFSAPRRVLVDPKFVNTLTDADRLSGGGEIFRLLVTGGVDGFQFLKQHVDAFVAGSVQATNDLVFASLAVKRSIVEFDEFEVDIRRSMNYGHSIGHAVEALTNYQIPHGTGVAIGMLVENRIARNRGMLNATSEQDIFATGIKLIPKQHWAVFAKIDSDQLLPFLTSDKKVEGTNLKLATLMSLGAMVFVDLPLDARGLEEIAMAVKQVVEDYEAHSIS